MYIVISDSETVREAEYLPEERVLKITSISGKVETYIDVSMEMFSTFEKASRMGMIYLKAAKETLGRPTVEKAKAKLEAMSFRTWQTVFERMR